ncbi:MULTISPECIES: molybdopterin molybdotransferase MoeA [Chryseobacterium]|uniref:Molybdopterin molybdenumtransferase n=1 Tax=Chryseobacterium camelliae TaxID=1265445 RepID=A0ABU0TFS1_9FLAO|nr:MULTISPECIES: gephyrin-like molybdotransferase Glp [Chryseobacterium]MDT3406292.1 molybdopterin molybdotransferase [Pseudacidovorax intermedius]MDQ1095910.1 molybdopterin molybdotransferase [Chryseobacterium camelliae]MDQ1099846.1 molybdopterin molybdotransferase [Chryseobacterium sp. SORGH_AS_1048]MDR6087192.1 molybdopterin molybdotransferase [Chryseobacterium sp. SORGH_AS_0909]MDR6131565.1 molybdopterin molybdotransferase [Chryseobacterium sp. SORGH_AS_1175]
MISVHEAHGIISASVPISKTKRISLSEAAGKVLSAEVVATVDIPNFSQSSMDGYALRYEDKDINLSVIGEMAAGTSCQLVIRPGQATRIFTGAPLPEGADTVVMQEKVKCSGNTLSIQDEQFTSGMNVRAKGSEIKQGETAMVPDTLLTPAAIGFLAGIGCHEVEVYYPPDVTIILTGNELQQPGNPLRFGQVYEANSFQLKAVLHQVGISNIRVRTAEDDPKKLQEVLSAALAESDLVLLNGGVSVGDYDFVVQAAEACGITKKIHKIRQKPGKPLFFGIMGDKMVFGLPGNPSSSLTCFYEYVLPALEQWMRHDSHLKKIKATVTHDYSKPSGLTHFLKAFYQDGKVTPLHAQESFRLHSFARANAFIVLPEESTGCSAGDWVKVHVLPG